MNPFDYEKSKNAMNEQAKRIYDSEVNGDDQAHKGFHSYEHPYIWDEEKPHSLTDIPTENFIPSPTYTVHEDTPKRKVIKAIKLALLILFIAFMIYCGVMIFIDSPELFKIKPDFSRGKLF